ncbi:MAG: VPLPA-CTERM sorting domain-containing protein [Pseudomonadota bacterium]
MNFRIALLFCAIFVATPALATQIRVAYSGVVSNTSGDGFGFTMGDSIAGSFLVNLAGLPPDGCGVPNQSCYSGTTNFVTPSPNHGVPFYTTTTDFYNILNIGTDELSVGSISTAPGGLRSEISIRAKDFSLVGFLNSADPNQSLSLTPRGSLSLRGTLQDINGGTRLAGFDLNTLTVTPVPLPAAVWLFGSGLLGLSLLRTRRVTQAA